MGLVSEFTLLVYAYGCLEYKLQGKELQPETCGGGGICIYFDSV